ncbi:E3 ubiquitin-protein ligase At1g63170 isoform X3 [Raphanus sativus]|uniref:RING-type E3 ubiquitin transferase n=1 Tax=Raphanus sativus TaxID=3726 RepID=A0A9W3CCX3_RAPSA|nr:E3 ubiquitin-protein ligase At1g63170 isoform X3 [Raphanus sativus]
MPIETTENDARPLILTGGGGGRRSARRQGLREAAERLLRHASSGRTTTMTAREPSMLVRETAAEELEERQSDWAYSKPVVVLDFVWNLAFVAVATAVLVLSSDEKPNTPLRVWTVGYGLQCVMHMVCVCLECRRRSSNRSPSSSCSESKSVCSYTKHLESANTMLSFIWWIIGFYWVSSGGQELAQGSPQLYWLCIVFLGFDVFFVVFCIALACVIGIAVCCCLPCIIAVLYAVAEQEGASKEDINQLTKFKFRKVGVSTFDEEQAKGDSGGVMTECGTDSPLQHTLPHEDAECSICLSVYEDETELRELPCGHHFHCNCVDKWLYINATCPLCKYNILKNSNYEDGEVV